MPYGVVVLGPAGSGKSSFCFFMQNYFSAKRKKCRVVNLDPAAEEFMYECDIDVRDLIKIDDVMEELNYGPNGGLIYAYEYILENFDWLEDKINEFISAYSTYNEDEIFFFDCSGQIELFSHMNIMKILIEKIQSYLSFRLCVVYCIDVTFIQDSAKLIAGNFTALSAMINLELPHINLLTKCDLVLGAQGLEQTIDISDLSGRKNGYDSDGYDEGSEDEDNDEDMESEVSEDLYGEVVEDLDGEVAEDLDEEGMKRKIAFKKEKKKQELAKLMWGGSLNEKGRYGKNKSKARLDKLFSSNFDVLNKKESSAEVYDKARQNLEEIINFSSRDLIEKLDKSMPPKFKNLNICIADLLDEFNLVSFTVMNSEDEESIMHVCNLIESIIQFDENQEVREHDVLNTM